MDGQPHLIRRWRLRHAAAAAALLLAAAAAGLRGDSASLRLAIADLAGRYGERYPHAAVLLARLAEAERGAAGAAGLEAAALVELTREALLAHPLLREQPLLFVVRSQYRPDHHNTATFFPGAAYEYNDGSFTPGGALKAIDLARGGAVTALVAAPEGVIRDPEVHFDGGRIVFALRRDRGDSYHIYEVRADGTELRQLTFASDVDDLDPLYLPDDAIVFSSTREPKYCMCNRHIMANLYRMEPDGANIHQIGKSTLFEGHASLLGDGRVLYDRWEYVDRNFGDAQGLWTVNPDGTNHALYWGNNTASPGAVLDGRAVPGAPQLLCVFGSCHDRPWGALALIDRRLGLEGRSPVLRTWPPEAVDLIRETGWELFDMFAGVRPKYEDPYPLDASFYLCSRQTGQDEQMGVFLIDRFGNEVLVHAEAPGCFDPMPLGRRPRPPVLAPRRDYHGAEGIFFVADVYEGTHMSGVPRGSVRFLRVVESPEKRSWTRPAWNGQGQEAPAMNWHDFNNKRVLGTVPVDADGSACFAVPADTFVYFQLLDADGMMVQSMRSGTVVQSGETASCEGCHENRRRAPLSLEGRPSQALAGAPSRLAGWQGPPRLFSYRAEVQPVWDRHCVSCHEHGGEAGDKLNLSGGRDLVFNTSYIELWRKGYIHVVGAGPAEHALPYSWGAAASRLVAVLRAGHNDVVLSGEEWERIVTWIDLNGPYYPSYASAHPDNLAGRCPLGASQLARLEELTGVPLSQLADHRSSRGPQVDFDRPERSLCLAGLAQARDARYEEALAIIDAGRAAFLARPEPDAPGFVPSDLDLWREAKYLGRVAAEGAMRAAIRAGSRRYDMACP